jgi:CheY-like chemotaxis protein
MNLVVNAREAMPEGGSLVMTTFRAERLPEGAGSDGSDHGLGAGYAVLRVEDSGMGMSADVRSRLFEPFFTTKKSGTGLGLATAYGIVKEAGGHLAVESEASHGATFTVYLPFCEDLPSTEHKAVPLTTLPRGSETILVVEDEPTIRELILRILEPLGYRVLAAANGDEALELTRSGHHAPDLLLSDLIMPGMSGEQLAAVLERENPRLEVLLMSGYNPRGEGGAPTHRLLHKPISPGSLARAVREALDAAS